MTTKRGVWRKSQVGCGDLLSIRKPSTVILVSPAWIYFICPRPSLPQIHTTPQLFQSMLYILTHLLGGGSSVSLRFASFYEQEGLPEIIFSFFETSPSQSDGWLLKISLWGDVCPDGSARQGVVDDLCLLKADFKVGPAVDWSPGGLGSGESGGCGWRGHHIFSLNVIASWAQISFNKGALELRVSSIIDWFLLMLSYLRLFLIFTIHHKEEKNGCKRKIFCFVIKVFSFYLFIPRFDQILFPKGMKYAKWTFTSFSAKVNVSYSSFKTFASTFWKFYIYKWVSDRRFLQGLRCHAIFEQVSPFWSSKKGGKAKRQICPKAVTHASHLPNPPARKGYEKCRFQ